LTAASETTLFLMRRSTFDTIGGFDERFTMPGGGFANYDFFERVLADPASPYIVLLGEGTFHQLHYGITTSAKGTAKELEPGLSIKEAFATEYTKLKGRPHRRPKRSPLLFGSIPNDAARELFFPPAPTRTAADQQIPQPVDY
jgi:hypothetical protein